MSVTETKSKAHRKFSKTIASKSGVYKKVHQAVFYKVGAGAQKHAKVRTPHLSSKQAAVQPVGRESQLAERLVSKVADASPDVNALCDEYGLKREELGRMTGFSLRALAEWAAGKLPSQPAIRRLHEVRRLLDALSEIVNRDSIPQWLHKPNPAFDRLTPLQVIEVGEIDRLWGMVYDMGSGQPE